MAIADVFYNVLTVHQRIPDSLGNSYTARDYMIKNEGSMEDHGARVSMGGSVYSLSPLSAALTFWGVASIFNGSALGFGTSLALGIGAAASAALVLPALAMWGTALYRAGKRRADIAAGRPVASAVTQREYERMAAKDSSYEVGFLSFMSQFMGGVSNLFVCSGLVLGMSPAFVLGFPVIAALSYSAAVHGNKMQATGLLLSQTREQKSVVPVESQSKEKGQVLSSIKRPKLSA